MENVTVFIGPRGSGKTEAVRKLIAESNQKIFFIDEYDINNTLSNSILHEMAVHGMKVVVATQGPVFADTSLPNSFHLHPLNT